MVPGPLVRACHICGADAPLFGVVDFNKSCLEANGGPRLPLCGQPVYYRRCNDCGLLFTDAFDAWTPEDWARRIYNNDYLMVDPDYASARPIANAKFLVSQFGAFANRLRVLDYGGGNGQLAAALRASGFDCDTYDPYVAAHSARPTRRYNLITCIEVLEHVPGPAVVSDIASLLEDDGLVAHTTLLQPYGLTDLSWWYVGPRNGHISLHTGESLKRLWAMFGFQAASANDDLHMAFRRVPEFASHMVRG